MAIDDNKIYGLTGAQIKELPEKIEAVKGLAKELTATDFNWPADNPNGVAMWLLPEGVYSCDATTGVYPDKGASTENRFLFFKFNSGAYSVMVYYEESSSSWKYWRTLTTTGTRDSFGRVTPEVIDSLTSTSTVAALSAAQGKALKDLIDSLAIRGAGAPTTTTVGQVGTLYEDTTNGDLYQLKSIDTTVTPNTYAWEEVGAGPTVVQTTGTSTTDVMSQNATTSMVWSDPSTKRKIAIGTGGSVYDLSIGIGPYSYAGTKGVAIGSSESASDGTGSSDYAVAIGHKAKAGQSNTVAVGHLARTIDHTTATAIGYSASARGQGSTAIGSGASAGYSANGAIALGNANATERGSISIGAYSSATAQGEMNIGSSETNYGYNSSNYRLLTGLYDPQNAHDAATKGYVDGLVGNIASALNVINNGGN